MHTKTLVSALALGAGLLLALPARAIDPPVISVLGNRADLVSGGNALVEISWPAGANSTVAKIALNGTLINSQFALRPNGKYQGVVTGLVNGNNVLTARVPGAGAQITIRNHPIGGPIFSGAQVQPWTCTTKVANPSLTNPDLGDPIDAQCNVAAPVYRYQYRTLAGAFATYDPANPPAPSAMTSVTTDEGVTVPYIVRIERGVINRGKYDIAYLANPANPTQGWQPWDASPSWNNKLYWVFGRAASTAACRPTRAASTSTTHCGAASWSRRRR